ncbi:hypothetical protein P4S93_09215 [Aneurinibacillus thermoaerophilus]|uniref:phage scaffolding protein n=1 Tax=Aneurinibacillus thermoaerophilus TaxID=143495 RepID=UPI002E21DF85|nr:hypothetical protein [Aneurinibacillus thermoaerophilus]MED0760957.1 hypothetical protein [Aneurinibacillus thermoaerophilus]
MKKFWMFNIQRFNEGGEGGSGGQGGDGTGAGNGGNGGAGSNVGGDNGTNKQPAVSFQTQEDYDKALQGAVTDYLKSLGIEKAEDLKGIIDAHKQQEEANKTAETKLAERDAELKTANSTIQSLQVENAFILEAIKQGIDPKKLSDAIRLADLSKVEVTDGGKIKNIDKHVSELVAAKPWLKVESTPTGHTPEQKPPGNTKTSIPNISDLRKMQRI